MINITDRNPRRDELLELLDNLVYYPRSEQAQIGRLAAATIRLQEQRITGLCGTIDTALEEAAP